MLLQSERVNKLGHLSGPKPGGQYKHVLLV